MSRNLLHKSMLPQFKDWLDRKRIQRREGKGEFQVIQVAWPDGQWNCVYDRIDAPEHYTVTRPMEPLVRRFIQARSAIAKPAVSGEPPSVSPEAHADFVRALHGEKGDLDAWLECYDETEVRAHVLALVHQPAASGEPFGYLWPTGMHPEFRFFQQRRDGVDGMPLYAAPQPAPARVPLTDEQINQITAAQWGAGLGAPYAAYRAYARAIEAAHGIGTSAKEAP